VIAKAGRPVARLVALAATARVRKVGVLKGKLALPDDFDAPMSAEELREFGIEA
jgi:antitoxin (DNA-binding transcriptional repressor) of toxin-antitoxin stability system